MIVTSESFDRVVDILSLESHLSLDTETTGLRWYAGDRLFSIIIANKEQAFYFSYNELDPHTHCLQRGSIQKLFSLFNDRTKTWYMHNAKFDMHMLAKEGATFAGIVHCTQAIARLVYSDHPSYSLSLCLKRMNKVLGRPGVEKLDIAKKYVQKHKLYTDVEIPGKGKPIREVYYHKIPGELMVPYAEADTLGTYQLGEYQRHNLAALVPKSPGILNLAAQERGVTKVCFDMEAKGININKTYNSSCITDEILQLRKIEQEWESMVGEPFKDSNVYFRKIFAKEGIEPGRTAKGNPSFTKDKLEEIDHPLASIITDWRAINKRVSSYYSSFQYYGVTGKIHGGVKQSGTAPGRMSYFEPNLQNLPKPDDEEKGPESSRIRRCFVPAPDHVFFMPDYDQMEYRLMLEMAGEQPLIDKINNEGLDVHTATAEMVGVTRKAAKTINFLLLYGGGAQKLADTLKIDLETARTMKKKYFARLPKIKYWFHRTIKECEERGYIVNAYGRVCQIPSSFAYKAPNYIIQGSCADVMKKAMVEVASYLTGSQAAMLVQVHDELLVEVHKSVLHVCPGIVDIMQNVYPHKRLKLTAGPKHSWISWADTVEGYTF